MNYTTELTKKGEWNMRSSNPALISNPFSGGFGLVSESHAMTVRGTVNKTVILLLLVCLPAMWVWRQFVFAGYNPSAVQTWMIGGLIGGFILSLATIFKKNWSPLTAPLYAVAEGLFFGRNVSYFRKKLSGYCFTGCFSFNRHFVSDACFLPGRMDTTHRKV